MKPLYIRQQQTVADPLQSERLLRALTIILEHQEDSNGSRTLCARLDPSAATRRDHRESTARSQRAPCNTTDGPCCPSMSISMMVSAAPGSIALPSTGCVMPPGVGSSMPW